MIRVTVWGENVHERESRAVAEIYPETMHECIAEGLRTGELTPRETARLERKEARIHREVQRDRAANGGALTPAERRRINRQQNRVSRQIYREKHDAQTR